MILLLCLLLLLPLAIARGEAFTFTDALQRKVILKKAPERVVAFLGSFGESWILAGGDLVGVTEDAISERGLALDGSVQLIGTTKKPNLEWTVALSPDLVLLSADLDAHLSLRPVMDAAGIPYAFFSVNTWQEYMDMMEILCQLTGRRDLYALQKTQVEAPIEGLLQSARTHPLYGKQTVLLLRTYSTGVKAKGSDNLAGAILRDMGLVNIADSQETLLENLTMEAILALNPDYIMITTMGSQVEAAMKALDREFAQNPAWQALDAVKNNRVIHLDRTLFHLKPNARWAESYQIIGDVLYAP